MFLRRVTFSATFSLMFLKESWAAKSSVPAASSQSLSIAQRQRLSFQPKDIRRRTEEYYTDFPPCDPSPASLYEGEDFLLDLFSAEFQPVCSCEIPSSGIDLVGFFANNPMPTNPDELQGWADTFNNGFLKDFRYESEYGCGNQCSFCFAQNDIDDCVMLETAQGGVATSMFFEGFTVEELTAIAAAPEDNAQMVDFRAGTSMESQFGRWCYTLTEGDSNKVCYITGLSYGDLVSSPFGAPFCTVSVDGVDCLSCDDTSTGEAGESIVADCTNIPSAPAMLDTTAGGLPGIYTPLSIILLLLDPTDNIQKTFGSCPAGEETMPEMEAAPEPEMEAAPEPEMEMPTEPAANTEGNTSPDDAESRATSLFLTGVWTSVVASATLLL